MTPRERLDYDFEPRGVAVRIGSEQPSPSRLLTPADVGEWVELVYYCGNTFAGTLRAYTDGAAHLTGDDGREKRVLLDGLQAAVVGRERESGGEA